MSMFHVRVVEATDLPKMDLFGKTDAYCILQYANDKNLMKTKVIEKSFKPVWNEEFHFKVKDLATDQLIILMKDEDKGSSDDPISRLVISLRDLPVGEVIEKWYSCTPVKGVKKGGKLRLTLHIAPEGAVAFQSGQGTHEKTMQAIGGLAGNMSLLSQGIKQMAMAPPADPQNPQSATQQPIQQQPVPSTTPEQIPSAEPQGAVQQPMGQQQQQQVAYPQQQPQGAIYMQPQPNMYQQQPPQPGMYQQQVPQQGMYQQQPGMYVPQQGMYQQQPGMYQQQPGMYAPQQGMYPQQQPGMYMQPQQGAYQQNPGMYPGQQAMYPQNPGMYPGQQRY